MIALTDFLLITIGALLGLTILLAWFLYKMWARRSKEVREIPRIPRAALASLLTAMRASGMHIIHMQETATDVWSIWVEQ
jgi:hypothetical protein